MLYHRGPNDPRVNPNGGRIHARILFKNLTRNPESKKVQTLQDGLMHT